MRKRPQVLLERADGVTPRHCYSVLYALRRVIDADPFYVHIA
ncbi:hypothetical protein [Arthrobacter sp. SO3]|nr:hypothetical protein [Arthrobacter sp. SO3]MCB5294243.1 hypothetical protein [Arthrobacter sp. SO3]